jgi:hypothetical protein
MESKHLDVMRAWIESRDLGSQLELMIAAAIRQYCGVFGRNNPQLNSQQLEAYRTRFFAEQPALVSKALLNVEKALLETLTAEEIALLGEMETSDRPAPATLFAKINDARLRAVTSIMQTDGLQAHQASTGLALRTI